MTRGREGAVRHVDGRELCDTWKGGSSATRGREVALGHVDGRELCGTWRGGWEALSSLLVHSSVSSFVTT